MLAIQTCWCQIRLDYLALVRQAKYVMLQISKEGFYETAQLQLSRKKF